MTHTLKHITFESSLFNIKTSSHARQPAFSETMLDWATVSRPSVDTMMQLTPDTRLRWSRGSVLAFGTQIRGFKPGRGSRIFQGEKILSTPFLGREVKPFVPSRRFKRSLKVMWKSGIFRQNSSAISCPGSSSFHY